MPEIILPHVFQDGVGEVASGVQLDEDLNVLAAAIEANKASVVAQLAGLKVRVGSGTATWAGGVAVATVTHGLGITPKYVSVVSVEGGSVFVSTFVTGVKAIGSTTFQALWQSLPGTVIADGATTLYNWVAVG